MLTAMYGFVLAFLILNTFSFYLLDYITDRMSIENAKNLTPSELRLYSTIRFMANVAAFGMALTITFNLISNLSRIFFS